MRLIKFAMPLLLLVACTVSAKADEIVFSGGVGGTSALVFSTTDPGTFAFAVTGAPLDALSINGIDVPFSGTLTILAGGDTTDSSGDLIFSTGALQVTGPGGNEVTDQFLGAEMVTDPSGCSLGPSCSEEFVAVLDPNSALFGDLLGSQGPLEAGIGGAQVVLLIPFAQDGVIGAAGPDVTSGVILLTPEPSAIALLALGLLGVASMFLLRKPHSFAH